MATPSYTGKPVIEEILNFKMRPDDVVIATYTKAGELILHNSDFYANEARRYYIK